ncbi:hypothetical protein SGLAM104S_02830 [Streptomyces glaucescens]
METSLGAVLAATPLGRRLDWCLGARFAPPPVEYYAWAELPGHATGPRSPPAHHSPFGHVVLALPQQPHRGARTEDALRDVSLQSEPNRQSLNCAECRRTGRMPRRQHSAAGETCDRAAPTRHRPVVGEPPGVRVRRDINRLRELGYPVTATKGPSAYYRLSRGARLPPLIVDDEHALAIALSLQTAPVSVTGMGDATKRALTPSRELLPPHLAHRLATFSVEQIENAWSSLRHRSIPPCSRS